MNDAMLDAETAGAEEVIRSGGITGEQLRQHIEAIERLEAEKAEISEQIKERFAAVKSDGFDAKIVKQIIKLRKMQPADVAEQEELLETYKAALGMP